MIFSGNSPFEDRVKELFANPEVSRLLGSSRDATRDASLFVWHRVFPASSDGTLHWVYLLITGALASLLFVIRRGRGAKDGAGVEQQRRFGAYLLPRSIYRSRDFLLDVKIYGFNTGLRALLVISGLLSLGGYGSHTVTRQLTSLFGARAGTAPSTAARLALGFTTLLCIDVAFTLLHLAFHRIRWAWEFHKVHHSATALNPMTRFRLHPVEDVAYTLTSVVAVALPVGVFRYFFPGIAEITLLKTGIFVSIYSMVGNFRHHHIQIRWRDLGLPAWLEYWLASPAQHQIHHSSDPRHHDKNLSTVFAFLDRLLGTLYVPAADEPTPWGFDPAQHGNYATVWATLWTPVVAALRPDPSGRPRRSR